MSESTQVRVAALGVLAFLGALVALAIAGKPPPLEATQDVAVVTPALAVVEATPAARAEPTATSLPTVPQLETERARISGEDGIFGLPGWPWRADDNAPSGLAWLKGGRAYTSSR